MMINNPRLRQHRRFGKIKEHEARASGFDRIGKFVSGENELTGFGIMRRYSAIEYTASALCTGGATRRCRWRLHLRSTLSVCAGGSVDTSAGVLDYLRPLGIFRLEMRTELLRSGTEGLYAQTRQPFLDVCALDNCVELAVELADDISRRTCRHCHTEPWCDFEARQARFRDGEYFGRSGRALCARDSQY